LQV
ncbi:hypothetical protein VCHENC02_5424B, partial [Vibrio harveyi]|jgi:hypothetical protein